MGLALAELWVMIDDPVVLMNSGLDLDALAEHVQNAYHNFFQADGKRTITDDQDLILHLNVIKKLRQKFALDVSEENHLSLLQELKTFLEKINQHDSARNQQWLLNRIQACGYETPVGCCYGVSHMGLQDFLIAEDLDIFNSRLRLVYETSIEDCRCDEAHTPFANLRSKQQRLLAAGEIEAAHALGAQIIEMQAFFDGIILHQSPELYQEFLKDDAKTIRQDGKKTLAMTVLETEPKKPVFMNSWSGAYDNEELVQCLEAMQTHLGKNDSFALKLGGSNHAINLNYDHKNKRWLLCNVNKLPVAEYIHLNLLADALFDSFREYAESEIDGLVLNFELYVRSTQKERMHINIQNLQETEVWQTLHAITPQKIKETYGRGYSQAKYSIFNTEKWREQAIIHMNVDGLIEQLKRAMMYHREDIIQLYTPTRLAEMFQKMNVNSLTDLLKCANENQQPEVVEKIQIILADRLLSKNGP